MGLEIEKFKKDIIRASSWRQLFSSEEEEAADYLKNIVASSKKEYESNNTLKTHKVEAHPDGDIHIFERTHEGSFSTYQKLTENGNVLISFINLKGTYSTTIVPKVGNINHNFTFLNTIIPSINFLMKFKEDELFEICGAYPSNLLFYLKGKPATEAWEETFLNNGHLPQRVGHRIFPSFVLEAQAKLLQKFPEQFELPQAKQLN